MLDVAVTKNGRSRRAPARKRSKLTAVGEEAATLAKKRLLLAVCDACGWNLTAAARALELTSASDVVRALKELAPAEYAGAQQRGLVSRQNRT